jgi:hypothetical protein
VSYGGVLACRLTEEHLYLDLSEKASKGLELPQQLSFRLLVGESDHDVLRKGLIRLGLLAESQSLSD